MACAPEKMPRMPEYSWVVVTIDRQTVAYIFQILFPISFPFESGCESLAYKLLENLVVLRQRNGNK